MASIQLSLPARFYEEEVRCGYTITPQTKRLWAVQLDLLNELLRVCRKHGLRLYPDGGTLLGAARHQGYIPWDDDIDMMMPRADYERLCQLAATEFSAPYFWQTEQTDPGSLRGHAQLRHSQTAMFTGKERHRYHYNMGIWIDIFPYDNVPDNADERQRFLGRLRSLKHRAHWAAKYYTRYYPAAWPWRPLKALMRMLMHVLWSRNVWFERFEREAQRYNNDPVRQMGAISFRPGKTKSIYDRALFDETIELPFEMFNLTVPKAYDTLLTTMYGDWHQFVVGGAIHNTNQTVDTEHSYLTYAK